MKLLLVYNPRAGHGKAGRRLPEIEGLCRQLDLEVDTRITERPGHATRIIEAENLAAFDGVVAAGGDGTVFEAVNGIFRNSAGPATPLGVLPVGTGNSFSRDLDLQTGQIHEAPSAKTLSDRISGRAHPLRRGRDLSRPPNQRRHRRTEDPLTRRRTHRDDPGRCHLPPPGVGGLFRIATRCSFARRARFS